MLTQKAATGFAGLNGGTTGGAGGTTTTVSSYDEFTQAVSGDEKKVVYVSGHIKKNTQQVPVGSNTSIIGKNADAILEGFGM
jgi:pectate lyase